MDEKQQELFLKLSMFEQQAQQLNNQLQAVENGLAELKSLNLGLDDLKNSEGKEVLSPVGRGIFIKSKIISEELIVDIGGKNLVKKNVSETQILLEEQISKLDRIKADLNENIEEISKEIEKTISESGGLVENI